MRTQDEINEAIAQHALWLQNQGGRRLDLSGCNLSDCNLIGSNLSYSTMIGSNLIGSNLSYSNLIGSNLSYSNLRCANLSDCNLIGSNLRGSTLIGSNLRCANLSDCNLIGANLSDCNLIGAGGIAYASCSWPAHGQSGRQLLAVRIDGADTYFCGCFAGSLSEIREYIEEGEGCFRDSRTIAADFVSARMAEQ